MNDTKLTMKINKLLEEFETFGIKIYREEDVFSEKLSKVLDSSLIFINFHRKYLSKVNDLDLELSVLKKEKNTFLEKILSFDDKMEKKTNKIKDQSIRISLLTDENEKLLKKVHQLEELNKSLWERTNQDKSLYKHHLQRLEMENKKFIDQKERNFGNYVLRDETLSKTIDKYKKNEEIYKETIEQLQSNNNTLLNEILLIKQDIMNMEKINQ